MVNGVIVYYLCVCVYSLRFKVYVCTVRVIVCESLVCVCTERDSVCITASVCMHRISQCGNGVHSLRVFESVCALRVTVFTHWDLYNLVKHHIRGHVEIEDKILQHRRDNYNYTCLIYTWNKEVIQSLKSPFSLETLAGNAATKKDIVGLNWGFTEAVTFLMS